MVIRVDPLILKQNSGTISSVGKDANQSGQDASNSTNNAPSYDGQFGPRVRAIGNEALAHAQNLFDQMNGLSSQLVSRAEAFLAADSAAIAGFVGVPSSPIQFPPQINISDPLLALLKRFFDLGSLSGGASISLLISLLAGGNLLAINWPALFGPNKPSWWPSGVPWSYNQTNPQTTKPNLSPSWEKIKLNQLDPAVIEAMKTYAPNANPFNACGPTSLAMLINYYLLLQGKNDDQLVKPAFLIKFAGQPPQNYFNDSLISWNELKQIAIHEGFSISPDGTSLSFDDLQNKVHSGQPIIVLARFSYESNRNYVPDPSGKPDHFVIVTDISNDKVTLINPNPGTGKTQISDVGTTTISIQDFQKIWTSEGLGIQP